METSIKTKNNNSKENVKNSVYKTKEVTSTIQTCLKMYDYMII